MKKFTTLINEASSVTVYHGNRFGTTKINPSHMNTSINEHGVGIYFTDNFDTAKTYGKHVVSAEISKNDFINSTDDTRKLGSSFANLLKYLYKLDAEGVWYFITDYGFELYEPEDVEEEHFKQITQRVSTEQIRHIQQTLVDYTSVENFVEAWNKTIKYKGTYQKMQTGETFYMIIDPRVKLQKVI